MGIMEDMFLPLKDFSIVELQNVIGSALSELAKKEHECSIKKITFEDNMDVNIHVVLNCKTATIFSEEEKKKE